MLIQMLDLGVVHAIFQLTSFTGIFLIAVDLNMQLIIVPTLFVLVPIISIYFIL